MEKRVAEALEKALPLLDQAQGDLQQMHRLRVKAGQAFLSSRYASLIDTYLPQIEAVVYISRVRPQVVGQGYALYRETAALGNLAADPWQVLGAPADAEKSLTAVVRRSRALEAELAAVEQGARRNAEQPPAVREEILQVVHLMGEGAALLETVSAAMQGLLGLAGSIERDGLLTHGFGAVAQTTLTDAEDRLSLALQKAAAVGSLFARPGKGGATSLPALPAANPIGAAGGPGDSLEALVTRAHDSVRFLRWFLGFQGPRTYLLLGQNQQEIRATGGFIGVAVKVTLEKGELVDLVFHDSTTVDPLPPNYPKNPLPPDPI